MQVVQDLDRTLWVAHWLTDRLTPVIIRPPTRLMHTQSTYQAHPTKQ